MIIVRTLRRDIAKYNKMDEEVDSFDFLSRLPALLDLVVLFSQISLRSSCMPKHDVLNIHIFYCWRMTQWKRLDGNWCMVMCSVRLKTRAYSCLLLARAYKSSAVLEL